MSLLFKKKRGGVRRERPKVQQAAADAAKKLEDATKGKEGEGKSTSRVICLN
jgi:hypothetical protein